LSQIAGFFGPVLQDDQSNLASWNAKKIYLEKN